MRYIIKFVNYSSLSEIQISRVSHASSSVAWDLHFYLRSILKGKTDIFFIKNCNKVNQAVPLLFIKLRDHAILPLQFCKEPFYLFLFRLLLRDGIPTSSSRAFVRSNRSASPSYLVWYSVWSRATWAFSLTHCCISSATTFSSS